MKKNKFNYGTEDLLPETIDRKDVSIRISIIMEGDLLDAVKTKAGIAGKPYQSFMKDVLREAVMNSADHRGQSEQSLIERVEQIELRLADLAGYERPKEAHQRRRPKTTTTTKKGARRASRAS